MVGMFRLFVQKTKIKHKVEKKNSIFCLKMKEKK